MGSGSSEHPGLGEFGARLRARHYAIGFDVGPPSGEGWTTVADLVDGGRPTDLLEELVAPTAASFPPDRSPAIRARVAAARVCYLWGWSVVAASLGPILLEKLAPDPAGVNVAVRAHGHHPGEVTFLSQVAGKAGKHGFTTADDLAAWWEGRLLGDNLDELHAAVGRRWRLGRRGLRGDLATDVAGVARVVGDLTGDVAGAARAARDLLERRGSRLRGLGVVTVVGDDGGRAVVYERATCCLYVKAVPGAICSNCPLLAPAERADALRARIGGG